MREKCCSDFGGDGGCVSLPLSHKQVSVCPGFFPDLSSAEPLVVRQVEARKPKGWFYQRLGSGAFYQISCDIPWKVEGMLSSQSKSMTTPQISKSSKPHFMLLTPQWHLKCRVWQAGFQRAGLAECQRVGAAAFPPADATWGGLMGPLKKNGCCSIEG